MPMLQGWSSNTNGTGLWGMLNSSFAWIPTQVNHPYAALPCLGFHALLPVH